jgi:hypothetical protein
MNINFDWVKKYWWVGVAVTYLGLGQYFEGLQPVFRFQMEAHAKAAYSEMAQTTEKLDQIACMQIVSYFINAVKDNDPFMIAHWRREALKFNCILPS